MVVFSIHRRTAPRAGHAARKKLGTNRTLFTSSPAAITRSGCLSFIGIMIHERSTTTASMS